MSQDTPNVPDQPQQPDPQPNPPLPPKNKPRRRRWPWVVLAIVVLLVLLVALLPTIASTSPVRSFVVGKINNQINGTVAIEDWSLGWNGPIEARGVKVYDEQKRLILDVPEAKITLSLMDAARQNFALGEGSVIEVASFVVNVDEQGTTNLEKLARTDTTTQPKSEQPATLPDISGKLTINIHQGTIEGAGVAKPIQVDPSRIVVNITDINEPIQNDVRIAYHVIDGSESSIIETSGTIDAIRNNIVDVSQLQAGQKVSLTKVNLAALEPFLKGLGADTRIAGLASGGIDIQAQGLAGLAASGQIVVNSVRFTGGPLGADTFQTEQITIPVNVTRGGEGAASVINFENVGVRMAGLDVTVSGKVPEQALRNLADQKPPGAEGAITITADVSDLPKFTEQLRNTLRLQPDVKVTGGRVHEKIDILFKPDRVTLAQTLEASAQGTRAGRPIQLQPITFVAGASALPAAGRELPEVRDINVDIKSAFATVSGGGESLAKIDLAGNFDLGKLHSEAAQFADLGQIQLAGAGSFDVSTQGDVTDENSPIKLVATSNLQNVRISGIADRQIDQDRLIVHAGGNLLRKDNSPTGIDAGYVSLVAGDPNAPLLDFDATANLDLSDPNQVKATWFELKKCAISSLATLQQQYGGMVPALAEQKIRIESGAFYAGAAGSYDGKTLVLSKPAAISLPTLTVTRDGKPLLNREIIRASALGTISLQDGVAANLTALDVTTQSNLFNLSKSADRPLTFTMKGDAIQGNGAMTVAADLKRLSDLAQAFGGDVAATSEQPKLGGGQLNGTLTLARTDATNIDFNGQISSLTIAVGGKNAVENEQMALALSAKAPADLNSDQPLEAAGSIKSGFANASLSNARLRTQADGLRMLQSASVDAQVTDLPKLSAVVNAFAPVLGDIQITSGGATAKVDIARDSSGRLMTINVPDLRVSRLALRQGSRDYAFDRDNPIALKLNAAIEGQDEVSAITINELSGDVRVASLTMPEKISITDLQSERPTVRGAIKLNGRIEDVTPLLSVIQDANPLPYTGTYVLDQRMGTQSNVTSLEGSIDITNFQVLGANRQPAFTEPRVSVRNAIFVRSADNVLNVETLTVEMPQSQALAMSFKGGVNDWAEKRVIRPNTKLDVTYDLEKLWTIIYPMLSPQTQESYKDLKLVGKHSKSFALSGAFPAAETMGESFRSLNAEGSFAIDLLDAMGLTIRKLEPTIKMERGIARINAPPAVANEGSLDLSEIALDMTHEDPLLSIASRKRILRDARMNPVLAASLGKFASLVFSNASDASGLLDVTVIECRNVPLGELLTKGTKARAVIAFSVRDLHLDGPVPDVLAQGLDLGRGGLNGGIADSTVTLENGQTKTDVTLQLNRQVRDERGNPATQALPLRFTGGIGLAELDLRNFQVAIPRQLIPTKLVGDDNIRRLLPETITVPFTGTVHKFNVDIPGAVLKSVGGGIIPRPGAGGNANPLEGILERITGEREQGREERRDR